MGEVTGGRGVDVVLDMLGGQYLQGNIESLALEDRLVQIGQLGGPTAEINMTPVLQRGFWITGSTLRPRSVAEKAAVAQAVHQNGWPLFESGGIRVLVHATLPLGEAAEAPRVMESSADIGKLVLVV